MNAAIIGGSGFYQLLDDTATKHTYSGPYGQAAFFMCDHEGLNLIFLPRHGENHTIPAHRINYRANIMALYEMEVDLILASYAVGSLNDTLPPGSIIAVDQFIDLTVDREGTFFDGEEFGLSHATDMTQPFCQTLREKAIKLGPKHGLQIKDGATYVAMRGPRFETAAESEMAKRLGGDVVGMTAVPEAPLARELGLHYAGFAIVTNYAPGIKGQPKVEYNLLDNYREPMLSLFLDVIQADFEEKCQCSAALNLRIPPVVWNLRRQA